MLIETIGDRRFADSVNYIAHSMMKEEEKNQYVEETYRLSLRDTVERILKSGGHIDAVTETGADTCLIVYTAEKELSPR